MRRHLFQFRLRTLFVLVTVASVACAIVVPLFQRWQYERERYERAAEAIRKFERLKVVHTGPSR